MSGAGIVVLVTGGRDFGEPWTTTDAKRLEHIARDERQQLFDVLGELHRSRSVRLVLHGACRDRVTSRLRGADGLAELWAIRNEVPYLGVPAQWTKHRKGAGPIRNSDLVDWWIEIARQGAKRGVVGPIEAVVVAFPGGSGTADLIRKASDYDVLDFTESRAPHRWKDEGEPSA